MLDVPLSRPLESERQINFRSITELSFRLVDVECAYLPKPICSAAEKRRVHAQRFAGHLAQPRRSPKRPKWEMPDLDRHAHGRSDVPNQIIEGVVTLISYNVRFAANTLFAGG